jgi:nitroreductase
MEFLETVRRRAMVRSFAQDDIEPEVVDRILRAALRAPSAGYTRGTAWVVLRGREETSRYWDATTDEAWRRRSPRWVGLQRAPVILLAYSSASAYVERYAEADKASSGLGQEAGTWPVPYWTGDAAFGVMTALLAAVDARLGACFLGNFRGESDLATSLGVPEDWELFGSVLIGRPDGGDHRSTSLERTSPDMNARVHHGRWRGEQGVAE